MRKFAFLLFVVSAFVFSSNIFAQNAKTESTSSSSKVSQKEKIKLEVFNDYQCPSCASFNEKLKNLREKFPNDLEIIIRHFPLTQIHNKAMLAAQAVEAAGRQNKFWEMSDLILEKQMEWRDRESTKNIFIDYAKELALNIKRFKSDLRSQSVIDKVDADVEYGKSLEVSGTPTIFLNGRKLDPDERDGLEEIIKESLSK